MGEVLLEKCYFQNSNYMKSTVLTLSAIAALVLGCSCSAERAQKSEKSLAEKIESTSNPDSLRMYVSEANAYIEKLTKEGKVDEAQKYLEEIKPVVEKKAPALVPSFVPTALGIAEEKARQSATELADKAKDAANDAADKAGDAVDKAKDKANDAVNKAKDKATDAVNKAKDKATDAANKIFK